MSWTQTPSEKRTFHNHSWTGWTIECEPYWTILQKMHCKKSTDVLCFEECLGLRHWKHFVFIGKNCSDNSHSMKKTGNNLFFKQMFDISEELIVGQSDEIFGVTPINWIDSMKWSSVSRMQRFTFSHILCYVLEGWIRTQDQILFWNSSSSGLKNSSQSRPLDTIDGEPMEFCSSKKSENSWTKWANQINSKGELCSCRCSVT